MTTAHTISVSVCFDSDWLSGFCFGVDTTKRELLSELRSVVLKHCEATTPCCVKVTASMCYPANHRWTAYATYLGQSAPRGCQIKALEREATKATTSFLKNKRRLETS